MARRPGTGNVVDAERMEIRRRVAAGERADLIAASLGLINLGVRDALRAPSRMGEAPRVMIAGGAGGVGTSALINTVVQSVAFKRDNRLKLQRAKDARRRHIFVPVDPSAGVAWAIVRETPPLIPPRLPSSVEVAWLVGANGRVLRCEPPGCWQAVSVDQLVWDEPNRWRVS